jgi:TonB family protein
MENDVMSCPACGENFARNFSFCPVCGAKLTASADHRAAPGYELTIVREKNVKQRNLLLFGAVLWLSALAAGGMIFSLFNKSLEVAAVETGDLFSFIADLDPVAIDPSEDLKKDKKKTGGGGGGRRDPDPVQKGREATQVDNPLFSPSKDYVSLTNPEIKIRAATEGTKQTPVTDDPYGFKNGGLIPSDGEGCCGGQGNGKQRGQGNDDGNGLGIGKDGGPGGGGAGPDGGKPEGEKDIPKVKTGVSQALKIISKPRASYTDAAREKLIQGKVVLRVTFTANGEIGAIAIVQGLAGGLTEQAVAAARAIKFEPARVNGSAVSVTKVIEYTFAIF